MELDRFKYCKNFLKIQISVELDTNPKTPNSNCMTGITLGFGVTAIVHYISDQEKILNDTLPAPFSRKFWVLGFLDSFN